MNFEEYKEYTHATAIYSPDDAIEYLALALESEAGEVAGVLSKAIRDETPVPLDDLTSELGDLCWDLAEIANLCGDGLFDEPCDAACNAPGRLRYLLGHKLAYRCTLLSGELLGRTIDQFVDGCPLENFDGVFEVVWDIAAAWGLAMDDIYEANLNKLKDRQERGKIGGKGNKR